MRKLVLCSLISPTSLKNFSLSTTSPLASTNPTLLLFCVSMSSNQGNDTNMCEYPYRFGMSSPLTSLFVLLSLQNGLVQTSTISEYDLGGEGDLFKAPEPIIEEPSLGIDPVAAAISMMSFGENVTSSQTVDVVDIGSIQSEGQLLSEVFLYECEKDLLGKSAVEEPLAEIPDIKIPSVHMEVDPISDKDGTNPESSFQNSVSSCCLSSTERICEGPLRSNFLDDFRIPYGMRRAYSDGDMQTLGSGRTSIIPSQFERTMTIGNCTIEERREKLTRYWKKKTKRNFGRKIKYACRKALADSQPRVRGRFAKTETVDISKKISV